MSKNQLAALGLLFPAAASVSQTFGAGISVIVDPTVRLGMIKPMNAVNNGPAKARGDQSRGNFAAYRAARIPFARTHDSIEQATSNGHTVDISAVFPDFDADENDPANYDFAYTDEFLSTIIAAGTEPFFRLGQTIENGIKKYHVYPPRDFAKWARICEHVIAHCTEGWAGGHRWNIRYWEIWNEPDAQLDEDLAKSCQWQGTKAQFFEFFTVVLTHLKARFPHLRIGGPSLGWRTEYGEELIRHLREAGAPLDFFSWHVYGGGIRLMKEKSVRLRSYLDENGFRETESILNEWNYVKDWTRNFPYSCDAIRGAKGGAFTAAAMAACQSRPVDMLMYYDARPGTVYNGLFDFYTFQPLPAYYAFTAWADLRELGTQIAASVAKADRQTDLVEVTAAAGDNGDIGILLARFCDDDNDTASERVVIRPANGRFEGKVRANLTDDGHLGSDFPLFPEADGSLVFDLAPNAFLFVGANIGHASE